MTLLPSLRPAEAAASALTEVQLSTQIRHTARIAARVAAQDAAVHRLTVGETGYVIRAQSVQSRSRPVVIVALERHAPALPSEKEVRERFALTPTEAAVAILLAERRSNREIAATLLVTEHTARRHTERVLSKLRIRRRTDVRDALAR